MPLHNQHPAITFFVQSLAQQYIVFKTLYRGYRAAKGTIAALMNQRRLICLNLPFELVVKITSVPHLCFYLKPNHPDHYGVEFGSLLFCLQFPGSEYGKNQPKTQNGSKRITN